HRTTRCRWSADRRVPVDRTRQYDAAGAPIGAREDAGVPPPCPGSATSGVGDRTAEEFGAGQTGPGVHLAQTANGPELILAPAVAGEFGAAVPGDWFVEPWKGGGTGEP